MIETRNFTIQTDRKINSNKPVIGVKNYIRKTCLPIDMPMPTDNNISIKEYNKQIQRCGNRN